MSVNDQELTALTIGPRLDDLEVQLKSVSLTSGAPESLFFEVTRILSFGQPGTIERILRVNPNLSELAAEASHFKLALDLGHLDPFTQARCHLFLGQIEPAEKIAQNLSLANKGLLARVINLQLHRMAGRADLAVKIYETDIKEHIANFDPNEVGEVLLQVGSAYFNSSQYQAALELYSVAYEKFEVINRPGKMAVAAFNAAVAACQLRLRDQQRTWLWYAEDVLKRYRLGALAKSLELFSVQLLLVEKKFKETILRARRFLSSDDLSLIQKVLGYQSLSEALAESGEILEAEVEASKARHIISANKFYQYEVFQAALELNLEVLTFRKYNRGKSINNPQSAPDLRALASFRLANIRKSLITGELSKARSLYDEYKTEFSESIRVAQNADDLDVEFSELGGSLPLTARSKERYLFKAITEKRIGNIKSFADQLAQRSEILPWEKILLLIAQCFLEMKSIDPKAALARTYIEEAIALCEQSGLERLSSICLGMSCICDPHRQIQWINFVNQLDRLDQQYLNRFFHSAFDADLMTGRWMISSQGKQLFSEEAGAQSSMSQADLVIDESKGSVLFRGESLPMGNQTVLFQLLVEMAHSQKKGLSKEEMVMKIWKYDYNPLVHDSMIYTNIRRLRELVPIELFQGKYRLSSNVTWVCVTEEKNNLTIEDLSERQKQILSALESGKSDIGRQEAVKMLNISERTALRELTALVEKNLLQKKGAGRSVKYYLARKNGRGT